VSGSVDYSGNAIDHAIAAQQQGKNVLMIADFMHTPALALLVRPADKEKYKSVRDLKGRTVGISSVGAATHVIGMWVARKAGLARDDIKFIGIGTGPTFVAGLSGGQVDAAWGTDPFVTKLIRDGRAAAMLDLFRPSPARAATAPTSRPPPPSSPRSSTRRRASRRSGCCTRRSSTRGRSSTRRPSSSCSPTTSGSMSTPRAGPSRARSSARSTSTPRSPMASRPTTA